MPIDPRRGLDAPVYVEGLREFCHSNLAEWFPRVYLLDGYSSGF